MMLNLSGHQQAATGQTAVTHRPPPRSRVLMDDLQEARQMLYDLVDQRLRVYQGETYWGSVTRLLMDLERQIDAIIAGQQPPLVDLRTFAGTGDHNHENAAVMARRQVNYVHPADQMRLIHERFLGVVEPITARLKQARVEVLTAFVMTSWEDAEQAWETRMGPDAPERFS